MELKYLEVVEMDNGELICAGKTVGMVKDIGKYAHIPYSVPCNAVECDHEVDVMQARFMDGNPFCGRHAAELDGFVD